MSGNFQKCKTCEVAVFTPRDKPLRETCLRCTVKNKPPDTFNRGPKFKLGGFYARRVKDNEIVCLETCMQTIGGKYLYYGKCSGKMEYYKEEELKHDSDGG